MSTLPAALFSDMVNGTAEQYGSWFAVAFGPSDSLLFSAAVLVVVASLRRGSVVSVPVTNTNNTVVGVGPVEVEVDFQQCSRR